MKCTICKNGETENGFTSVTFTKEKFVVVIQNVPAMICENCGESYVDENTTKELLKTAEEAFRNGVIIDVREYKAA